MRYFVRKGCVNGLRTIMEVCHHYQPTEREHQYDDNEPNSTEKKLLAFSRHCTQMSKLDLLERAALQNQLVIVKYLIKECECGVVNASANEERALYFASRVGNLEVVKYLIEACGCDPLSRRGKPLRYE